MTSTPDRPQKIRLHRKRQTLELDYGRGQPLELSAEYLRVFSPSAEVRGHGPGQEVLQWGKRDVNIDKVSAVGRYGVQICFDDGHDTGIYSWEYLARLGQDRQRNWDEYLERLADAGKSRDPQVQVLKL